MITSIEALPYSDVAEQATLGAMLFFNEARNNLVDTLKEEDFYQVVNREIFKNIKGYVAKNGESCTLDYVNFYAFLVERSALNRCGGERYLLNLQTNAPVPENAYSYAQTVREYSLRRKAMKQAEILVKNAKAENIDIIDTLNKASNELVNIQTQATSTEFVSVDELLTEQTNTVIKQSMFDANFGLMTGIRRIDGKVGGFKPSQYVIIAARPSCGKTALALTMMSNMLNSQVSNIQEVNRKYCETKHRPKIAFFSLEMKKEDIIKRLFSMRSLVPYWKIVQNRVGWKNGVKPQDEGNDEAMQLINSINQFAEIANNLYINDESSITISEIKTATRQLVKREHIDIVFIDYFSRIVVDKLGGNNAKDFERWNIVSRKLKSLANELNIPIVVLSQLTRTAETTKPTLADLRYTGALEQDADIVILLHNPARNGDTSRQTSGTYAVDGKSVKVNKITYIDIAIAKHRNGEIGSGNIPFLNDFVLFVNEHEII